eukprot:5711174-Pyramimonas_sp.AAC.1
MVEMSFPEATGEGLDWFEKEYEPEVEELEAEDDEATMEAEEEEAKLRGEDMDAAAEATALQACN